MKSFVPLTALMAIASVSAIGRVDPKKLPFGWCSSYTDNGCIGGAVVKACGANATYTASCNSTFSDDFVCTSFKLSCLCTPKEGGEQKDISLEALNETFILMPSPKMCPNLVAEKNASGPGLVSNGYKPGGVQPNVTNSADPSTDKGESSASTIQVAISTAILALLSLGISMA
ncbi:hypothetical protein BGZ76_000116 [Entomortierella beljakovae]|nr:hypothetical protein BGZ76_000116 [Entomortierella beljakovae]